MDQTKKGPGRPAHNTHPQSCSGQPITDTEMERREKQRQERKLLRQLDKQRKKLSHKGVQVTLKQLRQQYADVQRNYTKDQQLKINYSDYFYQLNSGTKLELSGICGSPHDDEPRLASTTTAAEDSIPKKSFSIDSLLYPEKSVRNPW